MNEAGIARPAYGRMAGRTAQYASAAIPAWQEGPMPKFRTLATT